MSFRGVLVGCGYTSGFQLAAWSRVPGVTIVGAADRDLRRARRRASEFGIPHVRRDLESLLEDTEPDFVDLATGPDSHLELVTKAASHGADILCQKPAANSLSELRQMIRVCDEAGVRLIINENARFQPWHRRIHDLIRRDHAIGEVISVEMESRSQFTMPKLDLGSQPFFATMPRLILLELGVHHLDTLRYLLGEASSISATIRRVSPHIVGEDEAVTVSQHDGVEATLDMSWARPPTRGGPGPKVTWSYMRIRGSQATLELGYDGNISIGNAPLGPHDWHATDGRQLGYDLMQRDFIHCLETGQAAETSARETLHTMELVFGAYMSARTERPYRIGTDIDALE